MIASAPIQSPAFPMMLYYDRSRNVSGREEPRAVLPVGLLLCGATSVSSYSIEWPLDYVVATNVGLSDSFFKVKPPSVQVALQEIKTTTGLTWQQLARVFKVTQRSLHLWMDGEALDPVHLERLYRVLTIVRKLPYSESFQNRTFLLSPQADGTILLDLLVAGDDDVFLARVERTPVSVNAGTTPSVDGRVPLPPSVLMDASQDTLHVSLPGRRAVKVVKRKGSAG
jgi:transcriptional regulator with XRE-family HTH domain